MSGMKNFILSILAVIILGCNRPTDKTQLLENRIESLQKELSETYKPGFGEFMSNIQAHHAKLWFASENENWRLADFEIHEIMESVDDIKKYETERKESKLIDMISPALDSVNIAIQQQNSEKFKSSFINLTNTCNACHQEVDFGFNVVKIPDEQTFSNQDFSVKK
jgi:hypothetical protein